ncbi:MULTISPECIES: slipin family protein [Tepidanaerobacter]|uniref:Regulator of protease activity HflC, stomatin/prohibitin superfamily n=1 Tax=Tepidanaerobacter syntrophicus TaxID=224999 RepID=A0A0U9HFW3_9FIRM|nr:MULTISPECIES: slipin family protein [Tepidanaerobacter]GAQ25728.1 regulator of protease activity HflC, stomatin/prohibitin superfamily [Tepidanaerobacter syntrophicus]GLI20098.1 membrane protein [Tepidanaerobacter syntrophicus]GLI51461.1 membrane protein [Tepidanaerobacter syntrophicus]
MNPLVTILTAIIAAEAVWWLVWVFLALARRKYSVFGVVLGTLAIWGTIAIFTIRASRYPFIIMPVGPLFTLVVLMIVPFIVLPSMVVIINEYQRGVLFRLGRLIGIIEPGFNIIFPFGIDRVVKIDLRTFTIDVAKQEVITKDNVPVLVDAVVYFNVFDPVLAVTKVANYTQSTTLLGQTILRSVLGQHELDEILSKRSELNEILRRLLDEDTDPWGIKITAVEIKSIELPDTMKRAMAKQAEAERERRAKIIAADGEYQAAQKLLEAASVISKEPAALQLRYLQTLSEIAVEKNSTILFPLPIELLKAFAPKEN